MSLKIKICGMREPENITAAAKLKPDLMGFIFYRGSPRFAGEILDPEITASLPAGIKKTGVFVNADFEEVSNTIRKYSLDIVQLHGNETPDVCRRLRDTGIQVMKAFNMIESSGFKECSEYLSASNYFLFDASSSAYGGSGNKFDWKIINDYGPGQPFFLSGGISPLDVGNILEIVNPSFYGIDLNSRFEVKPGLKDIETLKKFISEIRLNNKSL